jgi:hypothetical protein
MKEIYSEDRKKCKLVKAKPETVQFLLNYSKALKITEAEGLRFESILN